MLLRFARDAANAAARQPIPRCYSIYVGRAGGNGGIIITIRLGTFDGMCLKELVRRAMRRTLDNINKALNASRLAFQFTAISQNLPY